MPTTVGPNTKGEENLVFGYDLGDVSNSYKGEPTTNVIANTNLIYTVAGTYTTNTTVDGVRILENNQVNNSHVMWNGATGFIVTCSAGAYITVSAEYKTNCTVRMRFRDNPYDAQYDIDGGNIATISQVDVDIPNTQGKWVRYSATAQTSTANPDLWWYLVDYRNNNQFGRVEIRNWQIEVKSHATPFVNGTRSATQGLIDLTGNSTIDLSNVSFDSNAQMTFDGTNDYASVGYSTAINTPNGATYEIMLYPQGGGEFLSRGKSDSGTDPDNPRFYVDGTGYLYFDWSTTGADTYAVTPGSVITFNQWHHVVGVAQPGDQLRIYVNGVETSYSAVSRTVPTTVPNTEDPIIIGGVSWIPRYFDGKVAMVKLYNRALTASEIKANYNAIKGRFNI